MPSISTLGNIYSIHHEETPQRALRSNVCVCQSRWCDRVCAFSRHFGVVHTSIASISSFKHARVSILLLNMLNRNRAKARFKGAMRFIRSHEDSLRTDSLAKKLLCKNDQEIWKEINRMRSKVSLPNVIDGVTGSDSIVNMWRSHYNDLFNCIKKDMICIITCVMNQT